MKLRPSQLVCLALLLATLSYAGSPALAQTQLQIQMQVTYLRVLGDYGRILTAANRQLPQTLRRASARTIAPQPIRSYTVSPSDMAALQLPWTMKPPSAQYASLQAFTASIRPRA